MTDLAVANQSHLTKMTRPRRFLMWLVTDLRATLAIFVLLGLVIVAIGAPWIAPYAPTAQDVNNMLAAPGPGHLLGTDDLGRDIFSRLIWGAPATVYASLLAVSVAVAIGLPVGLIAGFFGGWIDDIISRVIDTFLSFPAIVLAIAVTGALGIGLTNGMIAVGIVMFPSLARIVRARTLIVRQELYVDASRCFGAPVWYILWKHVLPNTLATGHRAGDAAAGRGPAGGSQSQLSRSRHPAAQPELGRDAGPRLSIHGDRAGADVCARTGHSGRLIGFQCARRILAYRARSHHEGSLSS